MASDGFDPKLRDISAMLSVDAGSVDNDMSQPQGHEAELRGGDVSKQELGHEVETLMRGVGGGLTC